MGVFSYWHLAQEHNPVLVGFKPQPFDEEIDTLTTKLLHLSRLMGKPTMWFLNRSGTNWSVPSQKLARSLKFWI